MTEKWSDTEVKFVLHGTRGDGEFVLFQTKDRNWMIHRHGPSTRADPLPTSLKPMLATAGQLPPDGKDWAFEIKWDGVRAVLFVEGGRVRAQSRNDLDVTAAFPELADIGEFLGMTTCVLDGEIVALGEDGRPNFAAAPAPDARGESARGAPTCRDRPGELRRVRRPLPSRPVAAGRELRRAPRSARVAPPLGPELHDNRILPRRLRPRRPGGDRGERARGCRRQTADLARTSRDDVHRTGSR